MRALMRLSLLSSTSQSSKAPHEGNASRRRPDREKSGSTHSRQFLVATVKEAVPSPITLILNWKAKP